MTEPSFIRIQREFAHYLRDPENVSPPASLPLERLAVYSNAVLHNMEMFIGDNFPRVKEMMEPATWAAMVKDYVRRYKTSTAVFVDLPAEFLAYLDDYRDDEDDPSFLYELAHFEYLENQVSTDERHLTDVRADRGGDLLNEVPVINPTTQLVRYTYPVHTLSPDELPIEAPPTPTFIVAFRDRQHQFGFIDLNPATARVVELLLSGATQTGEQLLRVVAAELHHSDVQALIAGGTQILQRLAARDVILGTAKPQ